jgi:hypothetical protein
MYPSRIRRPHFGHGGSVRRDGMFASRYGDIVINSRSSAQAVRHPSADGPKSSRRSGPDALTGFRNRDDFLCQYFRGDVVLIGNSESRAGHLERDAHDARRLYIELMAVEIWHDRHDTLADRPTGAPLACAAAGGLSLPAV